MAPKRITREELGIKQAELFSLRSICGRGKTGCVITQEGRIISSGYNNPVKGDKLPCEGNCDLSKPCERAVHAEANAIAWAARKGSSLEGCDLFTTFSPCLNCAKLIVQAGIRRVFYQTPFRDNSGLLFLSKMNIETYHIKNGNSNT